MALVIAVAGVGGYFAFSGGSGGDTFTGRGHVDIAGPSYTTPYEGAPPLDGFTTDGGHCFANGPQASTTGAGDPIVLGVVGKSDIEGQFLGGVVHGDVCRISFEFDNVPAGAGDGNYLIRISGSNAIPTTETELRRGVELQLQ